MKLRIRHHLDGFDLNCEIQSPLYSLSSSSLTNKSTSKIIKLKSCKSSMN